MQFRNLLINVKNLLIINVILLVICVIAYVLIFVFWGFLEDRASYLPSVLLTTFSIFITAIITLLVSITIGGFYETYRRFQKLGIQDAEPARRGRETQETDKWLDRLVNAKKSITLVGVSLGGWFITGWPDLKSDLPRILSD